MCLNKEDLKRGTLLKHAGNVGFICDDYYEEQFPYRVIWEDVKRSICYDLKEMNKQGIEIASRDEYDKFYKNRKTN